MAEGDQKAYAEVYRRLYARFYNYGFKFTGDHVLIEDATQETLLLIWQKRNSISEIKYVSTYFYGAFRNLLFTKLRNRDTKITDQVIEEPDFSVEQILIEKEVGEELKLRLKDAIEKLTSRQREAIYLRFYEEMSYDEVASVLEITTKATYKIVARALGQLRELMICLFLLVPGFLN